MGLRDRLKGTLKSLLGDAHASDPRPPPTRPAAPPAPARAAAPAPTRPADAPVAAKTPTAPAPAKAPTAPAPAKATSEPAPVAAGAEVWTDVGAAASVVEGKAASLAHGDGVIAVFRRQGQLYAVDNACRHEDGPVGEGAVDGCRVQCPYHDWEYDFTTGECLSNPGNRLTTWRVEERDGRIRIGGVLRQGTDERGGEHNDGLKVITR